MECVRYEWKKFIAFRFFWLLCVVAFLFNLWNLSEQAKMSWPPAEAVKELYADLKRLKPTFLQQFCNVNEAGGL